MKTEHTAAPAGPAFASVKDVENHVKARMEKAIGDLQQQQQAPPANYQQAPPEAPATSPMVDQLNQLAALHQQGVLTDDEFTAAKAKLFST